MKKLVAIFCSIAVVVSLGITAFAADARPVHKAEKAETEKWETLTDKQKQEVYAIMNESLAIHAKLADKYLELELISKDTAEAIKEKINDRADEIIKDGKMPMFFGHKHHRSDKH